MGLAGCVAAFVATGLVDVIGHPVGGTKDLHSVADYLFTALLIPIALCLLGALAGLRRGQGGRDGRVGLVGFRVAGAGLAAFVVCGVLTLATANPDSAGPLYPLAMLATIVGLICMSVGANRARVLPRWVMPALTVAWVFFGPIAAGGSGGGSSPVAWRGSEFVFAALGTVVAALLAGRSRAQVS